MVPSYDMTCPLGPIGAIALACTSCKFISAVYAIVVTRILQALAPRVLMNAELGLGDVTAQTAQC